MAEKQSYVDLKFKNRFKVDLWEVVKGQSVNFWK